MLKANVGLTRKISRDFNSSGYSINVEGEITAPPDKPEAILDQIHRLYRLAEDALARQIDRDQGEQNLGNQDRDDRRDGNGSSRPAPNDRGTGPSNGRGQQANGNGNGLTDPATNKQVQYLLSLAKKHDLTKIQLEHRIEELLQKRITVYQLTKKEAGRVIDDLNQNAPVNGHR